MILSLRRCPDCGGSGNDARRGGLCGRCHGAGKRRETAEEAAAREAKADTCGCSLAVKGGCDMRCCY